MRKKKTQLTPVAYRDTEHAAEALWEDTKERGRGTWRTQLHEDQPTNQRRLHCHCH
jgi:hypothetical protein